MAHPFEVRKEIEVAASPDDVWEAIATGKGIDGWFLSTGNEVEPRVGGRMHMSFGEGESADSTVTAWEPPHRFAYSGEAAPDGTLHAFEYVIEARGGGRALVRLVHSGFLGDDWEAEYDALNEGDFMYLHLMAQYITHFRGRTPTTMTLVRPDELDGDRVLSRYRAALGLGDRPAEGDPVGADVEGVGRIDGVVDFMSRSIIGIRTDDALYRIAHSPQGAAFLDHHIYRPGIDREATRTAWQSWLDRTLA